MSKISADDKIHYCKQYLEGTLSQGQIAQILQVNKISVQRWIMKYESMGTEAFVKSGNKRYTKELKEQAVNDYLAGKGSLMGLCKKYGIHSSTQLSNWILKYNSHKELKASGTGGTVIMTKGRKTSFDERVEIASYCISHDFNYAETAIKFEVSYQQARNYTIKYEQDGINGLQDNRGKRKTEDSLSELERLRAELKLEKAKRKKAEMEASFLKKLDEIERRRG